MSYSKEQVERLLKNQNIICAAVAVREITIQTECNKAELRRLVNLACSNTAVNIPEDIE